MEHEPESVTAGVSPASRNADSAQGVQLPQTPDRVRTMASTVGNQAFGRLLRQNYRLGAQGPEPATDRRPLREIYGVTGAAPSVGAPGRLAHLSLDQLRVLATGLQATYGSQRASALLAIERVARTRPGYDPFDATWAGIDEWSIDAERYREYLDLTRPRHPHGHVEIGAGTIIRPQAPTTDGGVPRPDNDEDEVRRRLQSWRDAIQTGNWAEAWDDFSFLSDRVGNITDLIDAVGIDTGIVGEVVGPLGIVMTSIQVGLSIYRGMNAELASAQLMGWAYGAAYAAARIGGPHAEDAPTQGGVFHSAEENRRAFMTGVLSGRGLSNSEFGQLSAQEVAHGQSAVLNGLWQHAIYSYPEFRGSLRELHLQWSPPGVDRLNN